MFIGRNLVKTGHTYNRGFVNSALCGVVLSLNTSIILADGNKGLEEVVVTATKRASSLQDVPISITALTSTDIKNTGSQDFRDLSNNIPNITFPNGAGYYGSVDIAIRGIYSRVHLDQIGFDAGLGVYVDGVYTGKSMSSNADLLDIERVEVLRGPQGTLFGKNTIAGAINIVSKKPGNEFEGSIEAELGNYDLYRIKVGANIPIIENLLASRISLSKASRDGYITNVFLNDDDVGSYDNFSSRLQLAYTPTDETRVYLNVDIFDSDVKPYVLENLLGASSAYPSDNKHYTIYRDIEELSDQDNHGISLIVEHDLANGFSVTYISGFRDDITFIQSDVDSTPLFGDHAFLEVEQKMWTQEFRVSSPADTWYDYVAGLYYFNQRNNREILGELGSDWSPLLEGNIFTELSIDVVSYAAFVHSNIRLDDRFTLFAGARYTDETKEISKASQFNGDSPPSVSLFTEGDFSIPLDVEDRDPSWIVGLQYQITGDAMIYGSVSTGVKSGAFNAPFSYSDADLADPSSITVAPEFVTNYEIGFKSSWLDGQLRLNGAMFYMDYKDLQVRAYNPSGGLAGLGAIELSNAGAATSEGFELELSARPIEGLAITAGLGYVNAQFTDFEGLAAPRGGFIDASGNEIPLAPKITFNTAIQYDGTFGNGGSWMSRLEYNYVDERYAAEGAVGTREYLLPDYSVLNARIGFRTSDDHWGVYFWGKNLTNEQEPTEARFSAFITPRYAQRYLDPRTYGLSIGYQF